MQSQREADIRESRSAAWNTEPMDRTEAHGQAPKGQPDTALRRFMALYDSLQWHMYI